MRIVVVGGRSNAARVFRAHLAARNRHSVTVLTRAPQSPGVGETVFVVEDYFAPPPDLLRDADAVVNFAGLVSGPADILQSVNADGVARLAAAVKRCGVRQLVNISSLSVYGGAEDIDSATPETPIGAYGRSKLSGDRAMAMLSDERFLATSLRVPILYDRRSGSKLHLLVRMMARLHWFPAPRQCAPRSVLHLENLARAIEMVIEERLGGLRFAADPEPFRLDVLAGVFARKGRRVRLLRLPAAFFALIKIVAPGLHASLYGRSLIAPSACLSLKDPRTLHDSLGDLVCAAKAPPS